MLERLPGLRKDDEQIDVAPYPCWPPGPGPSVHTRVTGSSRVPSRSRVSSIYVDPSTNMADAAYLVHPDWQGLGLGAALQRTLMDYARARNLRGFTANVLVDNKRMLALLEKSGCRGVQAEQPRDLRAVHGVLSPHAEPCTRVIAFLRVRNTHPKSPSVPEGPARTRMDPHCAAADRWVAQRTRSLRGRTSGMDLALAWNL